MNDMLEKLYAAKAAASAADEAREPYEAVCERAERRTPERRRFRDAVASAAGPAIVAEIKRASPSVGLIVRDLDPGDIARQYQAAGANAISVLTEADHFLGELAFVEAARDASTLPILRKDFLRTRYEVAQSAAYGADCILAIVAGLDDAALAAMLDEAARFDLDVLVEVHDEADMRRAISAGATLVGINNRDLRTFVTELSVTADLLPLVPPGVVAISESGLRSRDDLQPLFAAGARGFLIGESLMRAADKVNFIRSLRGHVVPA